VSDERDGSRRLWSNARAAFWNDANESSIRLLTYVDAGSEYWEVVSEPASFVEVFKAANAGDEPALRVDEKVVHSGVVEQAGLN
jgi:hypothetical protein